MQVQFSNQLTWSLAEYKVEEKIYGNIKDLKLKRANKLLLSKIVKL